jgi:hypothetical protein
MFLFASGGIPFFLFTCYAFQVLVLIFLIISVAGAAGAARSCVRGATRTILSLYCIHAYFMPILLFLICDCRLTPLSPAD